MTDEPHVTELGALILDKLRDRAAAGHVWNSRADIAAEIGRPRITPHDIETLDDLRAAGLVKMKRVKTGVVRKEYRYKAADV